MASDNGQCCGHDHVGPDELWVTADELVDLIDASVDAVASLPGGANREQRRAAIRGAYARQEQEHAAARPAPQPAPAPEQDRPAPAPRRPASRGARHDDWATRFTRFWVGKE